MNLAMNICIERALKNIMHFGDTDIFPFPFERYLFQERFHESKKLVQDIHKNFSDFLAEEPPTTEVKLNQVGYYGFRSATQIEPFWNVYYLALVISIAEKIEKARIPLSDDTVYSYRYGWDEEKSSLFKEITWNDYKHKCLVKSRRYKYVVQADVSDFYLRINHHKLENELKRVAKGSDMPSRIMKLLSSFSGTASYGLPVGGPASRILAELALNHIDNHLEARSIEFCRYADDFTIFCKTQTDAYKCIILLAEKLANEGLSLQKTKTKIMTSKEFEDIHSFLDPLPSDNPVADEEQKLLNISIRFDPYSANPHEDYKELKKAISTIDIIGILSREVNKTRIDQTVTKQAINSVRVLDKKAQVHAIRILLDSDNLLTLAPVFTSIMRAVRSIYEELDLAGKNLVDKLLLKLFDDKNHLIGIELNLNYIIQVLAMRKSPQKEKLLIDLYDKTNDHILQRQIIVTMANWNCAYWLSDIKKKFNSQTLWERRAIIYSTFALGDEGNHWRQNNKKSFDKFEILVRDWSAERFAKSNPILT